MKIHVFWALLQIILIAPHLNNLFINWAQVLMTSVETRVGFDTTKSLMLKHKLYLTKKISAALSLFEDSIIRRFVFLT